MELRSICQRLWSSITGRSTTSAKTEEDLSARWQIRCIVCGKTQGPRDHWTEDYVVVGLCGYNFPYCPECEKDPEACGQALGHALERIRKQRQELREARRKADLDRECPPS